MRVSIPQYLAAILIICALGFGSSAFNDEHEAENLRLTPQEWRTDLQFFARELPKRHANAFHFTSKENFETAVVDLDHRLDQLDSDETWVGLAKITALVGDAHTYLQAPRDDPRFPLTLAKFGADYRVVAAGPGAEQALGTRLVKVQGTPVARASELLDQLFSQDENPTLAESYIASSLTLGGELHGLRIIADRSQARYTFVDDNGKEFELQLHATGSQASERLQWKLAADQTPLYRQHPGERFWCESLASTHTLYCNIRSMRDLAEPEKQILQLVKQRQPDKLVLDLRQNTGGDYNEGDKHLVFPIRGLSSINRKGHLFVLIGPNTLSAAMANAAHLRSQTAAIFVGRPIGEKPNSYQEPRQMTLPNSHLTVRYSTKFYKFVESGENVIRPDHEIPPSWDDYRAGRDPALEYVLNYRLDGARDTSRLD